MNIRSKITIPLIIMPLITSLIILGCCYFLFADQAERQENEIVTSASNTLGNDINDKLEEAPRTALGVSNDTVLDESIGDNSKVGKRTGELKDEYGVDFVLISDKGGNFVASSMSDEMTNEYCVENQVLKSALKGEITSLTDPGNGEHLSVQAGAPIYDTSGKIAGASVIGYFLDSEEYLNEMKELTGCNVTMSVGSLRVATTFVGEDGKSSVGTNINESIWDDVSQGNSYQGEVQQLGDTSFVEYRPLMNGDECIGMYIVGHSTNATEAATARFLIIGLIIAVILIIISAIIGFVVGGRISGPIKKLVGTAKKVASGNVNVDLSNDAKDETADLTKAFTELVASFKRQADALLKIADGDYTTELNPESSEDLVGNAIVSMVDSNNSLFEEIRHTSEEILKGSNQIAKSAQELSVGSSEQAATIQKFADTIHELQEQAKNSDHFAEKTLEESKETGRLMKESINYMQQMSEAMKEIDLGSKNIADIIGLIDSIAFQTNILALNAAVEAARAGAQGKGFAVVADEVKNLAAKSAQAVKETTELITSNLEKVEQGNQITLLADESLTQVVKISGNNEESMHEIKNNSASQAETINDLMEGIKKISIVVESNSAAAEENAAAAEEMASQSDNLDRTMSRFKTK